MNKYGNEIGFHTPILSKKHFDAIVNATGLKWLDTSWHNDLCDSMQCDFEEDTNAHVFITVFLPNSIDDVPENEKFNTFQVSNEQQQELFFSEDINKVITFIKTLL